MALLFWDASALAKRYFGEVGSDTVNALFAHSSSHDLATTPWGYAETYAMLLRKLNGGLLDLPTFTTAVTALQAEVVNGPDFALLSISDAAIFSSISLITKHNLNATDAALLTMLLQYVPALALGPSDCVVIASDKRLVRAADVEGFKTLNPEVFPVADVSIFLAGL